MTINLDFKSQTKAGLIAVIISGTIGVICAYNGLEVWALVIQGVINQLLASALLMYFARWRPTLVFSVNSFKRLFSFGSKLMLSNILTSIFINLSNLIIGKKYSPESLAYYNRGFTLSQFPSINLAEMMNRVIYPVLAEKQDDRMELKKEFLKYLHLSHFIILPLMGLLLVLAESLIVVLLTPKWIETVQYLQIFCINFMLYPVIQQTTNPVAVIGHSGVLLKYQVVKRLVSLAILIGTVMISVKAVCWGIVLSSLFEAVVNVLVVRKEIGVRLRDYLITQTDIIVTVVIVCVIVYFVTVLFENMLLKLLIGGTVGITLYLTAAYVFNFIEKDYLFRVVDRVKK